MEETGATFFAKFVDGFQIEANIWCTSSGKKCIMIYVHYQCLHSFDTCLVKKTNIFFLMSSIVRVLGDGARGNLLNEYCLNRRFNIFKLILCQQGG